MSLMDRYAREDQYNKNIEAKARAFDNQQAILAEESRVRDTRGVYDKGFTDAIRAMQTRQSPVVTEPSGFADQFNNTRRTV